VVRLDGRAEALAAADFHPLAAALAADPAKLVLALDYRGHGQSEYDRSPDNYALPVALADLSAVLIALEIAPAIFIGTSYGGLLTMMLAIWRPTAIAGVILNDIGPVIEPQGLVRLKAMSEASPSHATSRTVRKPCAGGSTRSSRSSHRRIGSRLPSAPGASTAAGSCPTTIRNWPGCCKEPISNIFRRYGITLTLWRGCP
jgi:pimeloyl-ACP methyl ester carboxylesterase